MWPFYFKAETWGSFKLMLTPFTISMIISSYQNKLDYENNNLKLDLTIQNLQKT